MLGSSAASLVQARTELGTVLAAATPDEAPLKVAAELFALVDALDADKALARALTNPNRSAAPKRALVRGAMAGHMPAATELVATVAAARWSREGDLADALEQLGFDAAIAAARSDQGLRRTEEELFGVDVVLRGSRPLRTALADAVAPPAARAKLARDVFGDAVGPVTLYLVERLVSRPRGRGLRAALSFVGDLVAAARERLVAEVAAARELSSAQLEILAEALRAKYGREVQLNVVVDPTVVGGLRCRVGDDVIDGTLATQFATWRRDLAA